MNRVGAGALLPGLLLVATGGLLCSWCLDLEYRFDDYFMIPTVEERLCGACLLDARGEFRGDDGEVLGDAWWFHNLEPVLWSSLLLDRTLSGEPLDPRLPVRVFGVSLPRESVDARARALGGRAALLGGRTGALQLTAWPIAE